MIRVLVADDQKLVRDGVCKLLDRSLETEVVGQAHDGQEAVERARRVRPDVVLIVQMPRLDGLKATRQIVEEQSGAKVLMVSASLEETVIREAMQLGAMGYLSKDDLAAELLPAILSLQANQSYFSQTVRRRYPHVTEAPPPQAGMSRHQRQVPSSDQLHNQLKHAKEEARINHDWARDVCQQSRKLQDRARRLLVERHSECPPAR